MNRSRIVSKIRESVAYLRSTGHFILSFLVGGTYRCLCNLHLCKPLVIVYVDGGICSQMHQYILGQIYAQRGEDVRYDLSWFSSNGWDVDHRYRRVYELERMFPDLEVKKSHSFETTFYRFFLKYSSREHQMPKILEGSRFAPAYMGGYYEEDDSIFRSLFSQLFLNQNTASVPFSFRKVFPEQKVCAVHVRRGDLAKGDNPYYGGVSDDYFFRAIDYVERQSPCSKYFFFSDEMDYVRVSLVPNLAVEYELIDGQFNAFEDLLLISKCDYIISSQGSFGKYAAMMNENSCLILNNDKFAKTWVARKDNAVII